MAQQRRGLGRGLGALIPDSPRPADSDAGRGPDAAAAAGPVPPGPGQPADVPVEVVGAHYQDIPVSAIAPNPRQPRRAFDEDALEELAESIRQVGLLQPVVVRALGPGRYELVMGERRWRAAQRAGLHEIPIVALDASDGMMAR